MENNYTTTKNRRSVRHSITDKLYSKIKEALTLDELIDKYTEDIEDSKATA